MLELVDGAASGLLHVVIVTVLVGPLAWWGAQRRGESLLGRQALRPLLLVAVVYITAMSIYALPRIGFFADLQWPWQNKLLLFVVLALLVSLLPGISWRDVGVRPPRRGWWIPVVSVIAAGAGLQALTGPLSKLSGNAETLLFQAIVPGLDEELLFRGVLLLLLDRALRSVPGDGISGSRIRWSAVVSSLLFGLGHGLLFTDGLELVFEPAAVVTTGLLGALLIWIRIRWDSLLPALLAHNAWNSTVVVANMLAG